jgi:hypothetical protein
VPDDRRHDATTEAVAVVPARALGGLPATRVLDALGLTRGLPQFGKHHKADL